MDHILAVDNKKEEKFLREKTKDFDFALQTRQEISNLILRMRKAMRAARGIGLSANQIGLPYKIFVADVSQENGAHKFYAVFNPKVEKLGNEKVAVEEGCLSVPGIYGRVERPERITISGYDKNGKPLKIKAWGLLARIFQHEIDHLNGMLFIDRTKNTYTAAKSERHKKREEEVRKENEEV